MSGNPTSSIDVLEAASDQATSAIMHQGESDPDLNMKVREIARLAVS